jgi:hypothetical protein
LEKQFKMDTKISDCQTITELKFLERENTLNEAEQRLVFERQMEIFQRIREWRKENEQLGLVADLSDTWTPEQREAFMCDWQNDEPVTGRGQKRSRDEMNEDGGIRDEPLLQAGQKRSHDEMNDDGGTPDESLLQYGRGQKRSHDEMNDGASDEVSDDFFTVTDEKQVNVRKFKTKGMSYTINFMDTFAHLELSQFHDRLHEIFQRVFDRVTRDIPSHDQVRFVLHSPQLEYPISLPFMPRQRLTTERVLAEFERVIQSNQEFRLNDTVNIDIIHVEMPHGGRGTKRSEVNLEKHLMDKRSIVRIQNKDDLCLARALVVAEAKIDNDSQYKSIVDHRRPLQTRLARELHQNSGVPLGPCGLDEVKQFQTYMSEYQINIVSKEHQKTFLYSGPEQEKNIYLFLHDNHYDVITSMPGFLARGIYCHTCKKAYDHQREHLCPNACRFCRFPDCPIVSWIHCDRCNRYFRSQECFDRHKQSVGKSKSICSDLVKCPDCNTVVKRSKKKPDKHHCGMTKCPICKEYTRSGDHHCYMQPVKKRNTDVSDDESDDEAEEDVAKDGYNQLLFFDFECHQENGNHEPNLCVIQNEAGEEWSFQGDNTRNEFCEWLFTTEHANCIVMAHNFQGYDSYFILQYLRENSVKYDVIIRGAKVLTVSVPMFKIKFIDSLSFIPMRLADFPKIFGLNELAKGYFPHLFNKKENQNYIGPLPPSPYYYPDGMSSTEREKFMEWHNGLKENSYVFNFQEEILSYCRSDVDILRRCCLEFRELFRDVTDIDPFEKCLTIASACNLVFERVSSKQIPLPSSLHMVTIRKSSNLTLP